MKPGKASLIGFYVHIFAETTSHIVNVSVSVHVDISVSVSICLLLYYMEPDIVART